MPARIDILTHSDGRPQIQRGDFAVGPADLQHQEDILAAAPGHIINDPLLGVNLFEYLKARDTAETRNALRRRIAVQLARDGYDTAAIDLESLVALAVQAAEIE
jgi:hypothetical protein